MKYLSSAAAAIALIVAISPAAFAQDAVTPEPEVETDGAEPTPDLGLSLGEDVNGEDAIGSTYRAAEHGDWEMRCIRTPEGEPDPCNLYQLLSDAEGNDVAEISLFPLPDGGQAVAGATIVTPLETLLTEQVTIAVDSANAKRYPFTFCAPIGCFSRVGLTESDVAAFKAGRAATLSIVPFGAPDQRVTLDISLTGFTAGYDAVAAANAAQ